MIKIIKRTDFHLEIEDDYGNVLYHVRRLMNSSGDWCISSNTMDDEIPIPHVQLVIDFINKNFS